MRHPTRNHRHIAHVHRADITIDVELELPLQDEHDLLLHVYMHRRLGVRLERHEIEHRVLTQDRSEPEPGQELDLDTVAGRRR